MEEEVSRPGKRELTPLQQDTLREVVDLIYRIVTREEQERKPGDGGPRHED